MLPLAFVSIAFGVVLVRAAIKNETIRAVISGHPERQEGLAPSGIEEAFGGGGGGGVTEAGLAGTAASGAAHSAGAGYPVAPNPFTLGGSGSTGLPKEALKALEAIARQHGWNVESWLEIIERESGGNPTARNPTTGAYGIGQLNPENAANPFSPRPGSTASRYPKYKGNPVQQIEAMAEYIAATYGNPTKALQSEYERGYY